MHGGVLWIDSLMNVKTYKDAIAKKCRQCVGPWNSRYDATPAELIDVCDKTTCGLHKLRPRIIEVKSDIERMLREVIE
jgi:hypothetical protein